MLQAAALGESLQQHRESIWFLSSSSQGSKGLQTEVAVGGLCFLFSSFCWRDSAGSWWGAMVPRLQHWWEVVN